MVGDATRGRGRAKDWKRRADQLALDTEELSTRLRQLQSAVTNPDNDIRVVVDSSGALLDLKFRETAKSLPASELAEEILRTLREAQRQLLRGAQQIVNDTVGAESPTGKTLLASYQSRFAAE